MDKVLPFFKNEFQDCMLGDSDLREVLPDYLNSWNWEKSLDDFLEYWFSGEKDVNNNLLKFNKAEYNNPNL